MIKYLIMVGPIFASIIPVTPTTLIFDIAYGLYTLPIYPSSLFTKLTCPICIRRPIKADTGGVVLPARAASGPHPPTGGSAASDFDFG